MALIVQTHCQNKLCPKELSVYSLQSGLLDPGDGGGWIVSCHGSGRHFRCLEGSMVHGWHIKRTNNHCPEGLLLLGVVVRNLHLQRIL